ncbi:MAG: T9SS type A sorting domain-containing protein, partial [Bacteroidales bacterium]|nr:T9SS type A sorting domain-containing protein [Bacteroidales bacterium]
GCFTSGSVTGNNFVGGLVGDNLLGATFQNCGSRAAVTGEEYVGGLAGANLETIQNCYATGLVTATTGGGGLVDGNVAVNNSFWDTETTGLSGSEGGTGKTSTEMKDIATFTNTATSGLTTAWDFVGTTNNDAGTDDWWNMNLISAKTDNDGYPVPSWWVVTDVPSGDGSSGTPYQIATLNNLYWLSQGGGTAIWDDNKYFEQPADIAAKSTAYINKGQGFSPIGANNSNHFNGSYDGQNHAIDYLFINRPGQNRGLIGYINNGGDLSNLGITNADFTGGDNTAMLVGYLYADNNAMEITNCYASGSVAGDDFVGGLIGQFRLGNLTITSCHVSGSVEGGLYNVGGMIGGIVEGNQTLENSYSTVDVTAEGTQGGLIGRIFNSGGEVVTISSCYSSGDITISKDGEFTSYAGGLVGLIVQAGAGSKIENCYSLGNITDNATSNSGDIGGLIGRKGSSNISIDYCYSTGAVPSGGTGNTGGLIGNLLAGSGTACFWDTETSGTTVGVGNTSDPTWVTGETTANMQTQSTFTNAGWDFTSIWAMDGTTNDGYAYLQNNTPSGTVLAWTGNSSSDWNTAGNWSGDFIPTGSNNLNIPLTANQPEIGSSVHANCNNLSIDNDASLNILSDASGTGSLVVTGTASGDINVQRYLDVNDKASKWHYVSAPVSGQLINDDFMTNNSIYSPNGTNYNFYRWDEDTDYWIIYGSTGNPEAFSDGSFFSGRGYALSRSSSGVVNFEGSIRTDDVSYSATYTSGQGAGWNLVGNPFTSALAVTTDATTDDKFLTNTTNASFLDDNYTALYIWDEGTGYAYGEDDYKVIGNPVLGSYTQIDQDYVQPGQAFMVKVSSSGNLKFNEDMQAHADVGFFKEKESWPHLELLVTGQGLSNTTAIGFHEGMTNGLGPSYDVGKLKGNPDIALYTRLVEDNGIDFAIQALPCFKEDYSIPVGIDLSQAGEYSFEVIGMKQIPDEVHVYFEDKQSELVLNLRETTKYTCMLNGAESITDRFMLHFTMTPFGTDEVDAKTGKIKIWSSCNTINLHNPDQIKGTIKIFNLYGQQIMQTKLNGNQQQQILIEVPAAYYLVNVISEKAMISEKVFVY